MVTASIVASARAALRVPQLNFGCSELVLPMGDASSIAISQLSGAEDDQMGIIGMAKARLGLKSGAVRQTPVTHLDQPDFVVEIENSLRLWDNANWRRLHTF
jgi:hypothetical protein